MNTRNRVALTLSLSALIMAAFVAAATRGPDRPAHETWQLNQPLVTHLQAGMNEQDVFLAKEGGAFRITAADADLNAPLYTTAEGVPHNPASSSDVGPYTLGEPLGVTQGAWLAGGGSLTVRCEEGQGTVTADLEKLIPNATYTLWQSYVVAPPTVPFKAIDLPLGALDGSQNTFQTDGRGRAAFSVVLEACVPLSTEQLMTVLAIAYHSDGRTHGLEPGAFGHNSHVQLFTTLPTPAQMGLAAQR